WPPGPGAGLRRAQCLRRHNALQRPEHGPAERGPGDRATGESYCLAHHLTEAEDGSRTLMVASIRCLDTFVKQHGAWLFAERRLMVNWTDTRPSVS
ncbi:MAG TPA: nuclear transport factor 2 family protein, partial [Streptosporangiaceae bacterium]|nr:nuclear transport factor 2 family protein [Streptosporangiaceae bacterium]